MDKHRDSIEQGVVDWFKRSPPKQKSDTNDSFGRWVHEHRRELILGWVIFVSATWLSAFPDALPWVLFTLGCTLVQPAVWRWVPRWLGVSKTRRDWNAAAVACGFDYPTRRHGPRVEHVREVSVGWKLRVRLGRGLSSKALQARTPELAVALHVEEVRITKDRGDASRATVTLINNDPFDDYIDVDGRPLSVEEIERDPDAGHIRPIPWPLQDAPRFDMWDSIPLGINDFGDERRVNLIGKNLLIGGEPEAGKSIALGNICSAGALDPNCRLWLFDGKRLDLGIWSACAERYVGPDVKEAIEAVKKLQVIMDKRYVELERRGQERLERSDRLPLYLVVVDELAFYMNSSSSTKEKHDIRERFRDVVARGRAAGIIFVGATQKPDADTIPSALRDLITYRLAFKCTTWDMSDTILGKGTYTRGFDASEIPTRQRGVGLFKIGGRDPVRVRGYFSSRTERKQIAERAASNRLEREWAEAETVSSS
jgi:hypothetical protein